MRYYFADTSGWGNLIDPTENLHLIAAQCYASRRNQGFVALTTNYIIAELVALLTSPLRIRRQTIISFVESLQTSPYVEIVNIDETLDAAAWQLLKTRADKNWSLVDCASFVLMRQRGITDAFTTDHHFEQAGFTRLLK